MFLEMWELCCQTHECFADFYPADGYPQRRGSYGYVQPYADSPMDDENVCEHVYMQILNQAKDYVYITTPYLIIDGSMVSALCLAAKSGVDVRIITPQVWDKALIHICALVCKSKLTRQLVFSPQVVIIQKGNELPLGLLNTDISGSGHASIVFQRNYSNSVIALCFLLDKLQRIILRAVIYYQQLKIGVSLIKYTVDCLLYKTVTIVVRHHNSNKRLLRSFHLLFLSPHIKDYSSDSSQRV